MDGIDGMLDSIYNSIRRLDRKRMAYRRLFTGDYSCDAHGNDQRKADAALVLAHLKKFCKPDQPAFVVDDPYGRQSALRAGRQEVFMLIAQHINLSDADMARLMEE